jgi:PKD repeat protein
MGTWTVQAIDPQMGALGYTVEWGTICQPGTRCAPIEVTEIPASGAKYAIYKTSPSKPSVQVMTFNHTYQGAGAYSIKVTARNSAGLTAEASATVKVIEVRPTPITPASTKQTSSVWDSVKTLFGF